MPNLVILALIVLELWLLASKKLGPVSLDQVDGALGAHFGLHHWIPLIFSRLDPKSKLVWLISFKHESQKCEFFVGGRKKIRVL